jgi:hypothetical protein
MSQLPLDKALVLAGHAGLAKTAVARRDEDYLFNSRDATMISFVQAYVKKASEATKQTCRDHAAFWGNLADCEAAVAKVATYKPAELEAKDFAMVAKHGGLEVRKFAAYDAPSVIASAVQFAETKRSYPLEWRKEAAARLLERAQRFGAHLPEYVETSLHKSAGFGYPSAESLQAALDQRVGALETHPELFDKLASLVEVMTEKPELRYDDDFVKEAVAALEHFDVETGIAVKTASVELPEEIIDSAQTTEKLAKLAGISKQAVALTNGATVDIAELSKEALAAVDPALAKLGSEELAAVLPTLPRGDADLLVRLA